jgi:hypothetical protein
MPIEAPGPLNEVTNPTVISAANTFVAAKRRPATATQNRNIMTNLHPMFAGSMPFWTSCPSGLSFKTCAKKPLWTFAKIALTLKLL